MAASPEPRNADQIAFWNGLAGDIWTERQEAQDEFLVPVSNLVLDLAAPRSGETVIDIGCGCGATTIEIARRVGSSGHVLGIDVSERMLARARERAAAMPNARFDLADATTYDFAPASADLMFSRFGVMFFADPVASFANMRRALKAGARLAFVAWREARLNPWSMVPLQAAYKHVPKLPVPGPDDPGQFSFGSEERLRRILAGAGFTDIDIRPHEIMFDLAIGRGLEAAVAMMMKLGPVVRATLDRSATEIAAVEASIREELSAHADGNSVRLPGAVWTVTARSP